MPFVPTRLVEGDSLATLLVVGRLLVFAGSVSGRGTSGKRILRCPAWFSGPAGPRHRHRDGRGLWHVEALVAQQCPGTDPRPPQGSLSQKEKQHGTPETQSEPPCLALPGAVSEPTGTASQGELSRPSPCGPAGQDGRRAPRFCLSGVFCLRMLVSLFRPGRGLLFPASLHLFEVLTQGQSRR